MDRAACHALLDVMLDAAERVAKANSPDALAAADQDVVAAHQNFLVTSGISEVFRRRVGENMRAPTPLDPLAPTADMMVVNQPVTPGTLRDKGAVAAYRRGVSRHLQDFSFLLPPGLADFFAAALLLLNMGEPPWPLFRAHRTKGIRGGRRYWRDFAEWSLIYYDAGFKRKSLEVTAREAFGAKGDRWEALEKARSLHKWTPLLIVERDRGRRDKATRRPYDPPYGHYDLAMLEKLPNLPAP
jgi:hypothetical protein